MVRFFRLSVLAGAVTVVSGGAFAAPDFPMTRNTVGTDEYYPLDEFGPWSVHCLRRDDDQDLCEASTTLSKPEDGLELDLSITPIELGRHQTEAEVNVVPVASVNIVPYSKASHYNQYSAAISAVDGEPFDGQYYT